MQERTAAEIDSVNAGFVYLVVCAVNQVAPEADLVAQMDLDAIYGLARRHMMAAAVGVALEQAGIYNESFARARDQAIRKTVLLSTDLAAVTKRLEAEGIWYAPLKGILIQHLYPVFGMREMSDQDILVDKDRIDDVRTIMEGLGFTAEHFGVSNEDVYYKQPVSNFEMHWMLFGAHDDERLYAYYKDAAERLVGDGYEKRFNPDDSYVYLVAHEYKHFAVHGTGLRSLADTYLYLRNTDLDMDYVAAETDKMGAGQFEVANRSLALHLFSGAELTEADQQMLAYILRSGVYGTVTQRVENALAEKGYGKLRYALSRLMVPVSRDSKEYEVSAAVYPVFYGHKVLLPLLPFYRVGRALKNGRFQAELKALVEAKTPRHG